MPEGPFRRSDCERLQRRPPARNQHWAEAVSRQMQVLKIAAYIAGFVTATFGVMQTISEPGVLNIGLINLGTAAIFWRRCVMRCFDSLLRTAIAYAAGSPTMKTFLRPRVMAV